MESNKSEIPTLGSCCACGLYGPTVRNVMALDKRGVIPGHGWGCVACKVPADGASVVICDTCLENKRELKYACRGYPATEGRITSTGVFQLLFLWLCNALR